MDTLQFTAYSDSMIGNIINDATSYYQYGIMAISWSAIGQRHRVSIFFINNKILNLYNILLFN